MVEAVSNPENISNGDFVITLDEINVRSGLFLPEGSLGLVTEVFNEDGGFVYSVVFYKKARRALRGDFISMHITGDFIRAANPDDIESIEREQYERMLNLGQQKNLF